MMSCPKCSEEPNLVDIYAEMLHEYVVILDNDIGGNNIIKRKELNCCFIYAIKCHLGRSIRRKVPNCVANFIREIFPNP